MTGCNGACCAVFTIPTAMCIAAAVNPQRFRPGEAEQIGEMVIPLTAEQARERYARLGYGERSGDDSTVQLFTCRNWDEGTRLCTVYASRPAMCSGYPYGGQCAHRDECECKGS